MHRCLTAARTLRAQRKAMPVIGFLSGTAPVPNPPLIAAFRQGLGESGYVEGQNVTIEYRWAEFRMTGCLHSPPTSLAGTST